MYLKRKLFIILIVQFLFTFKAFTEENTSHSAYGAIEFGVSKILTKTGLCLGVKGGWVIGHTFVIGAEYAKLINSITTEVSIYGNNYKPKINFSYGGLFFEYIFFFDKPIKVSAKMLFAGGAARFFSDNPDYPIPNNLQFAANCLIWQPVINVEIKLYDWLNVSAGFGYRYVTDMGNFNGYGNNDFKSLTWLLVFKFGEY